MNAENIMKFPEINRFRPDTAEMVTGFYKDFITARQVPEWLKGIETSALTMVEKQGLPTPKLERWKFTNLTRAIKPEQMHMAVADIHTESPDYDVARIEELLPSCPQWLRDVFDQYPARDDYDLLALWYLNNVFLRDGLVIDVPKNTKINVPVEIYLNGHNNQFTTPRMIFRLAEGAEITVIEYHRGEGHYWKNQLTQAIIGPNAKLRHYRIQEDSADAVYTQQTHATIERFGTYEALTLNKGGALCRNQVHAELDGEGAHIELNGVNLGRGRQIQDATYLVEHKAPHCTSNQFVRTVLDEQARGIYQGKVHVHQPAQKTDGYQLSNALLLSEGAEMDTKPELEIYADDVKCSHGATTGQLDDEPLFYLRSRGLNEVEARALLIEAFLAEVIEKSTADALHSEFTQRVKTWLGH